MFLSEIDGMSHTQIAIYIKLQLIYWTAGNTLPAIDSKLHRRLGIKDPQGEMILADILNEFFPLDLEDNYSHIELDRQLNAVLEDSKRQSERASKPRGNNKPQVIITPSDASEVDDDQF